MSSIKSSIPFTPAYPPVAKGHIDSDQSRTNPLDKTAGEDAEVSNGKGGWKNVGSEYRAHANRNRIDQPTLPSNKKIIDDSQANAQLYRPDHNFLPSDKKTIDDSQANANHDPIDVEIKPDGKGGWVQA
ncbi:hypothetical protein [Pseudomonas sp. AM4(2022)]|uniref:hypothetical protein n=1 Tax=Pseudomonas sp. AM4(2022) TaxID=2983408 RepID=UPI002E801D9F|nr:hypothetical protein [Pseudomonas sp. AM4(2022)]